MNVFQVPLRRRQFFTRVLGVLTGGAWLAKVAPAAAGDQAYVGEIRVFAGGYAPAGWRFCEGQLLPISEHSTLYSLIGTTYGGDGLSSFALPDLRGRAPVHRGNGWTLGENRGVEAVALTIEQLPAHTHAAGASSSPGTSASPAGMVPARDARGTPSFGGSPDVTMAPRALLAAGGSAAHDNMQPYLGVHYIISLTGVDPRS